METIRFSIGINAPRETVWETVTGEESYKQWTSAFDPTSSYRGAWTKGSKILFLACDQDGKECGMSSEIAESRFPEFISIRHLGTYADGVEDFTSENAAAWASAYENYTLNEADGGTEFLVEMQTIADHKDMFEKMWPAALQNLRALAEAQSV